MKFVLLLLPAIVFGRRYECISTDVCQLQQHCCQDCATWDACTYVFTYYGQRMNMTCSLNDKGLGLNYTGYDLDTVYGYNQRPFHDVVKTYNRTSMNISALMTTDIRAREPLVCKVGNDIQTMTYMDVDYFPRKVTNVKCRTNGAILNCYWNTGYYNFVGDMRATAVVAGRSCRTTSLNSCRMNDWETPSYVDVNIAIISLRTRDMVRTYKRIHVTAMIDCTRLRIVEVLNLI